MQPLLLDDSPARCLDCRYPLRGLTESRCPECGREFDPSDADTMYWGRARTRWVTLLLTPPGRAFHITAVVAAIVVLVDAAAPGESLLVLMAAFSAWVALGAVWIVRFAAFVPAAWYINAQLFRQRRIWRRWGTIPVIVALTICMLWLRVPLHLTFWSSRPAMDRLAREVMATPVETPLVQERWVGLYHTDRIERFEGGMRFVTGLSAFGDQEGFAYSPDGPPPRVRENYYSHWWGPWYTWRESW